MMWGTIEEMREVFRRMIYEFMDKTNHGLLEKENGWYFKGVNLIYISEQSSLDGGFAISLTISEPNQKIGIQVYPNHPPEDDDFKVFSKYLKDYYKTKWNMTLFNTYDRQSPFSQRAEPLTYDELKDWFSKQVEMSLKSLLESINNVE